MFKNRFRKKQVPTSHYEGKEHMMSYKQMDPEKSKHTVRIPEDEPHMKSRITKQEAHQEEDDYHFKTPHRKEKLPANLPDKHGRDGEISPMKRVGNLVTTTNKPMVDEHESGYEDEEEEASKPRALPKEHRKGMIIAVLQRKLKKNSQ